MFGCGGIAIGASAQDGARSGAAQRCVFLTSDNPRSEDPAAILREIEIGVREALTEKRIRYEVIADRRAAIEAAVRRASPATRC